MNEPNARAQRQPAPPKSLIWRLITLPFHIFGVLLGSLLLSLLIECMGMTLFWPQQGWRHAQDMLTFEVNQLSTNFSHSVLMSEPGQTSARWAAFGYQRLLVDTGLAEQEHSAQAQPRRYQSDMRNYLDRLSAQLKHYLIALIYTVLVFGVRLIVLCLCLPFCVVAVLVGVIDGLVRRDLRRFGAGRESGFIYHRAKSCLIPLTALPWTVYLASPVSISPLLLIVPTTALLAIMTSITVANFKKHL
ncbi:hypothetical protein PS664_02238 [Pseudomonas fluorescens]|nr:hypothetical protein PS664_02238 [Pseudomonas fluorescens]